MRCGIFLCGLGLVTSLALWSFGQGVPAPGLTVIPVGTNQLQITITNLTAGVAYEIYRRPLLEDPAYFWTFESRGLINQSNFVINMGLDYIGFFRASVGTNWDGDSAPNDTDGQPSSTNAAALAITIDLPTQGATLP